MSFHSIEATTDSQKPVPLMPLVIWDGRLLALFLLPMMISLQMGGGLVAKLYPTLATPWTVACQGLCPWDFPGKNTGVGCHFPSPGNLPNPGIEPMSLGLAGRLFVSIPYKWSFPGGSASKESTCNVGDLGSIPRLGRSPQGGHGNPLQYSCLGNFLDRGTWWATVHGVTKTQILPSD